MCEYVTINTWLCTSLQMKCRSSASIEHVVTLVGSGKYKQKQEDSKKIAIKPRLEMID